MKLFLDTADVHLADRHTLRAQGGNDDCLHGGHGALQVAGHLVLHGLEHAHDLTALAAVPRRSRIWRKSKYILSSSKYYQNVKI